MVRGERPIKLGDSWFSPKCIWVQPWMFRDGGRALDGLGAYKLTDLSQTPNAVTLESRSETAGDKLRSREGNSPDRQLRPLNVP